MTTGSSSIAGLLVLGIVFHLVYIATVFDCYFASPVVHGMRQYKLPQAQAKRLVLIVGAQTPSPPCEGLLTLFLAFNR
jgi:phosphatidylinositol glycan class N